jgi:hypothetical protein
VAKLAYFPLCASTRVFGVSRCSSVSVVTRLLAARFGVWLPGWARDFGLCERSWVILGTDFSFSEPEIVHSPSSTGCFFSYFYYKRRLNAPPALLHTSLVGDVCRSMTWARQTIALAMTFRMSSSRMHLERLQNKCTNCKGVKNDTNFGQITGIQEKLNTTYK